jgi:hypothetical protein
LYFFCCSYRSRGIEFDQIWGWEGQHLDPNEYWAAVPHEMVGKIHFYNVAVTSEPAEPHRQALSLSAPKTLLELNI